MSAEEDERFQSVFGEGIIIRFFLLPVGLKYCFVNITKPTFDNEIDRHRHGANLR